MGVEVAAAGQVLLAVVLLVSGVSKALDPTGTRTAAGALGVPEGLTRATAVLLPVAELLVAVLLVAAPQLGLLLALVLLSAFTTAVALTLADGRRPTCNCFGRLGGVKVSSKTLARNGLLIAVGLVSFWLGGGRVTLLPALVGAALAAALLGLEVLDGRRSQAREQQALEDSLEQTRPAPDFTAPLLKGGTTSRDVLLSAGRPLLLVVLSPGCGPCMRLVPYLHRWGRDHGDVLTLAVLGVSSPGFVRDLVGDLAMPVLVDEGGPVRDLLGTSGTPSAVLLAADGQQVGQPAAGLVGIHRLLQEALERAGAAPLDPDALGLDDVLTPSPSVRLEPAEDGSGVLVDDLTSARLQLDRTGTLVWSLLDGTGRLGDIVADLADVFGAPVEVVERDVLTLVRDVGRAGLLAGVSAKEPADA